MPRTPGPDEQVERRAPDRPSKLPKRSWWAVLKGTVREFQADELADRAAALTYYGVLSLFPALLVLVSLLGIAGKSATQQVLDNIAKLAPSSTRDEINSFLGHFGSDEDRHKFSSANAAALFGLEL